jgi:signal transduction histidine kinase
LSAMQMLKSGYPEAGQRTHIQIDASQSSDLQVACDPAILQTAYFNLLENAIKYGNNRAVRVRLFLLDKAVCLEVEDKGAGIDPKEMERLFEPFYRSDKNRALRGSGIGLSLVKSVADQYGGHVRMDSQLGIGTTVHLRMPKYDADHPGAITGKGVQNDVVLKI